MLRTFRRLRLGQIALAIASILAVTGSLGLHPEPTVALFGHASEGIARCHSPQAPHGAPHDCLACRAHRSVSIPRLVGVLLAAGTAVPISFCRRTERPLPVPSRTHAGRAPPTSA